MSDSIDLVILLERAVLNPVVVESYINSVVKLLNIVVLLGQCNFDIHGKPASFYHELSREKMEEMKYAVIKSYLLLREKLVSSNLHCKRLVKQYNLIYKNMSNFNEEQRMRFLKKKQDIEKLVKNIDTNKNKIAKISDSLSNFEGLSRVTMKRKEMIELMDGDEQKFEKMMQTLPNYMYEKYTDKEDEVNYRIQVRLNMSLETLIKTHTFLELQMSSLAEVVELNRGEWEKLSCRFQKLTEALKHIEMEE